MALGEQARRRERRVAHPALHDRRLRLLPHRRPAEVRARERLATLRAPVGHDVRVDRDEAILLLLGVDPFDLPLADQVGERQRAPGEVVEVGAGGAGDAALHDHEGAAQATLVAVDDDLVHLVIVADVDLVGLVAERRGEGPGPATLADLADEVDRLGVEPDQVPVDVDPCRAPALGRGGFLQHVRPDLAGVQVAEDERDLLLVGAFGDVDAEGVVLDEAAVLALGGLVGAEASPLGRVQVAGLEVRLRPSERARHPAKVADRRHVARPVEHLADARPAADPVPRGERVDEPLRQEVRPDRAGDPEVLLARERALELVLEVLEEEREGDPEEVLHEVPRELEALVRVVVLVVLPPDLEVELEDRSRHPREVQGLLETVRLRVAEVGEEGAVEDAVDFPLAVLLRLARRELLLEEDERVLGRLDPLGGVELLRNALLDVDVEEMLHRLDERFVQREQLAEDRLEDLLVVLHPEGLHQDHERDLPARRRDRDLEDAVLLLLDDRQRPVAAALAEHLRALDRRAVPFVVLREDPVGREVLEADDDPLRAADDRVAARVERVFAVLDELRAVLVVREPDSGRPR